MRGLRHGDVEMIVPVVVNSLLFESYDWKQNMFYGIS